MRALENSSATLHTRDLAMFNGILSRQSTMMAYNDTYTLLARLFLLSLPLTLLLPRRGVPVETSAAEREE